MRILLVEDDLQLGEALQESLELQHYLVSWHKSGERVLESLRTQTIDLIILDIGLPGRSGLEVLADIRASGSLTPVLVLTARDTIHDRVQGLDAGADDYLLKPFDLAELLARIRSLLRRQTGRALNTLSYGDLSLDPIAMSVMFKNQAIILSRQEFSLLKNLLEHVGQVLTRDQLEKSLYGDDSEIESNSLEVHIHHLRKKFGSPLIKTLRGIGYMIPKLSH